MRARYYYRNSGLGTLQRYECEARGNHLLPWARNGRLRKVISQHRIIYLPYTFRTNFLYRAKMLSKPAYLVLLIG